MPVSEPLPLKGLIDSFAKPGELYRREPDGRLLCFACGHRCRISDGYAGVCRVRSHREGVLYVPKGYVGALQLDPIEKKPFFHALPGARALSFGMLGCDFHCAYCQNWFTSQAMRDEEAGGQPREVSPGAIVALARRSGSRVVASTYNEPLITSEWAVDVFREARAAGLVCAYISNGNGTEEVLDYLRPWVDLYKADLKAMRGPAYRRLGGRLETVLDTIGLLHRKGFWLEIVTLLVPGMNDSDEEVRDAARFLASVSRDIPWHVTAFHPDYKMDTTPATPVSTLLRAAEIGREEGLRFVYAGNRPGEVGPWEDTRCPGCAAALVRRCGFRVLENRLTPAGSCPDCGAAIPGRWA